MLRTKEFIVRACAWLFVALALHACGGGGTAGLPDTSVPNVPISGFWLAPDSSSNNGFVLVDGTGFMVGRVTTSEPEQTVDAMFAGHAAVLPDATWAVHPADFGYRVTPTGSLSSAVFGTGTVNITGTVQPHGSLVVNVPRQPLSLGVTSPLTLGFSAPDPNFPTASLATLQGLYMHGSQGIEFTIDSAGNLAGQLNSTCRFTAVAVVTDSTSPIYTFFTTLQGPGCPGPSGAAWRFLGYLTTAHQPPGADQGDAVLHMAGLVNEDLVTFDAVHITNPNTAIPDGSVSPVAGFADPSVPAVTSVLKNMYFGYAGPNATVGDSFTPPISILVDASGRFIATISSSSMPTTPNAEDVIMGTFAVDGNIAQSVGAIVSHRSASASTFVTGTVTVTATLGPDQNPSAQPRMHLTLSSSTLPLIASSFTLEPGYLGYAPDTASLPHGGWFNGGNIRIDGQTGRITGVYAPSCLMEGTMRVTNPNRNIYRLRAAFSGTGCAGAGVPEGVGEFIGFLDVGLHQYDGIALVFTGTVNGQLATLAIVYPSPLY
jgi:hypothetical protein